MPANPAPPNAVVPSVLLGLSLLVSAGLAARAPRTFDALGPCVPGLFAPLQATREAVPLALAHHRGAVYALLATPDREGFSVEVFRLRGGLSTRIATRRAPSLDAISGFVVGPNGPMFAVARRETVTVTTLGDAVRDAEFPRGEQPEGRPALTPTIALAAEPTAPPRRSWAGRASTPPVASTPATSARARRTPPPAATPSAPTTSRSSTTAPSSSRSTAKAPSPRPPRTASPSSSRASRCPPSTSSVLGRSGSPTPPTATRPTSPRSPPPTRPRSWSPTPPRARSSSCGSPPSPRLSAGGCSTASTRQRLRPTPSRATSAPPPAPATPCSRGARPPPCFSARSTRAPAASGRSPASLHPRGRTPLASPSSAPGALTLVATHGARGVSVYSAFQDPDCSLDLRPIALPNTPAFGPGARLAGFAGDDARAVLAVTHATLDDARTPLTFATIATATGLASATPPPETIPSSVRDLGIFNAPTAVVAGFSARGLRLQRVGDVSDDGEAGEDLLIRGSRAAEFVLASSPSLRRVWVADTAGPEPSDFGPAGSVVLYSAVDTLEDGPRTEIRMGAVPYAAFRRLTLDPLTLASRPNHLAAWAATWSASAEPDCLPGAFAALYGSDDQPLARVAQSPSEPFAHAVALVPTPIARCGDRVDAIAWSGDRFAAALSGEALGERLVFGSIDSGVPSHDSPAVDEASIRSLTVARLGAGIAAAWVSGPAGNERLRYRLFRMNGSSHGAPHTLGRLDRAPARPVILSASGDALAAMAVTANGPVVLQSQCRLP